MSKYRKRATAIEAIQWQPDRVDEVLSWIDTSSDDPPPVTVVGVKLLIDTPLATLVAKPGDYLIRGPLGDVYPCGEKTFEAFYEPVGADG